MNPKSRKKIEHLKGVVTNSHYDLFTFEPRNQSIENKLIACSVFFLSVFFALDGSPSSETICSASNLSFSPVFVPPLPSFFIMEGLMEVIFHDSTNQ